MTDANSQFFAILTKVGMAKQANADALGIPWKLTDMGVGDANNIDPVVPSETQTKLINEWRRKPLNRLFIDPVNPAVIIAEQIIPADEGGKWIREIGLYDTDGDLVAVANCAPSFKPLLSQGSGRTQIVRMNFVVSNAGNIQLKIDPSVVLASRAYVDAAILEVLPKNKTAGQWTRVKTNDRGIVVEGDNPGTLAGMGIKDAYTKPEIESMVAQATEIKQGTAKIATQVQLDDGASDETIVTPAKIKFGFSAMFATAGWIRLPKFLGGLTLSWQQVTASSAGLTVALPIAVANRFLGTWAQHLGPKGGPAYTSSMSFDDAAKNTVNITSSVSGAAAFTIFVLSY